MKQLPLSLVFATQNRNKLSEIQSLLGDEFQLITLAEAGITHELEETTDTLEGNALQKARAVYALTRKPCFADDSGLEVEALNGAPGVNSAMYAGNQRSAEDNMAKLLHELAGHTNRKACFRTVIAWKNGEEEKLFEGRVEGEIALQPAGNSGFGYDPVFVPHGDTRSFAEMSLSEKNAQSHRARAFKAFTGWLTQNSGVE
ncbi:MAG: RdgB/HAM1 family non-canonical purine NTP pyrophosphatase [Bacteroidia bacterium]|jgi:XTP/dITP diphosphohydrolase|nr:RdgB/HAM1 family non-canonical purine NTP pyrophosphatase [Bacteroidia bacterium]